MKVFWIPLSKKKELQHDLIEWTCTITNSHINGKHGVICVFYFGSMNAPSEALKNAWEWKRRRRKKNVVKILFYMNKGFSLRFNAFDLDLFKSVSATMAECIFIFNENEQQVVQQLFFCCWGKHSLKSPSGSIVN